MFAVFVLVPSVARADDPPAWLQEAARTSTPTYEVKDVPAVVLRNEESVSVDSDGKVTRTRRFAIRILTREGRREAIASVVYNTDSEKVKDIDAWLIRRAGQNKSYGKKEMIDARLPAKRPL